MNYNAINKLTKKFAQMAVQPLKNDGPKVSQNNPRDAINAVSPQIQDKFWEVVDKIDPDGKLFFIIEVPCTYKIIAKKSANVVISFRPDMNALNYYKDGTDENEAKFKTYLANSNKIATAANNKIKQTCSTIATQSVKNSDAYNVDDEASYIVIAGIK